MKKNVSVFFITAAASGIAVFLFSGVFAAPQAHAYAVGTSTASTSIGGSDYNVGSSLQNLVSPFTTFFQSLQWNSSASINLNGTPGTTWPVVNFTPVVEGALQGWLTTWFSEFDNWFYHLTGVQLSGIMFAILSVLSWVLRLTENVVNWLLGLFH
jgi:hypothetical protein